jgi:hypothetical protein
MIGDVSETSCPFERLEINYRSARCSIYGAWTNIATLLRLALCRLPTFCSTWLKRGTAGIYLSLTTFCQKTDGHVKYNRNLMFCWPCVSVYRYSDWPCVTVYRYSDWPCITAYQYSEWPCITVYQYSDWPCVTVYQHSDWPCISVYQYNETNAIHFSFSLLRIKGLLHVSSITCSSSGFAAQTTFGILLACYVSCHCHDSSFTVFP